MLPLDGVHMNILLHWIFLFQVMQPEPPANNHPYYATNQNAVAPEIELLQDDIGEKDMDQMFKDVETIMVSLLD